eukprot:scaffold18705_cov35-Phaeocystis_antarctica.AAC.3
MVARPAVRSVAQPSRSHRGQLHRPGSALERPDHAATTITITPVSGRRRMRVSEQPVRHGALACTQKSVSDAFGCWPPRPRAAPRLAVPMALSVIASLQSARHRRS